MEKNTKLPLYNNYVKKDYEMGLSFGTRMMQAAAGLASGTIEQRQQQKTIDISDPMQRMQVAPNITKRLMPFTSSDQGRVRLVTSIARATGSTRINVGRPAQSYTNPRTTAAATNYSFADGSNQIIVPSANVSENLLNHEFAHSIQHAIGSVHKPLTGIPVIRSWLANYSRYIQETGIKPDHVPIGQGGVGYFAPLSRWRNIRQKYGLC